MLYLEMKARVQSHMTNAKRVSLCTDVWTKRGMTSSYLGVTGHFFYHGNDNTSGIHAATLAVRCMEGSITGVAIRNTMEDLLVEWDIPPEKVMVVVTDNASNMVRAFKEHVLVAKGREEVVSNEEEVTEGEGVAEELDALLEPAQGSDNIVYEDDVE